MNYSAIKTYDIANGSGVRTSLFVSGCTHHCRGCFNPDTWDFNAGEPFGADTIDEIIKDCESDRVAGLSLLGGEPLDPANQPAILELLRRFKECYPQKDVWCYTGYVYEDDLLSETGRARCDCTGEILSMIDTLVDGPFIEAEKDITLKFRGSRNQRIINLKETPV